MWGAASPPAHPERSHGGRSGWLRGCARHRHRLTLNAAMAAVLGGYEVARGIVIGSPSAQPHPSQRQRNAAAAAAAQPRTLLVSYVPGATGDPTSRSPASLEGLITVTSSPSFFGNGRSKQNGRYVAHGTESKLMRPRASADPAGRSEMGFAVLPDRSKPSRRLRSGIVAAGAALYLGRAVVADSQVRRGQAGNRRGGRAAQNPTSARTAAAAATAAGGDGSGKRAAETPQAISCDGTTHPPVRSVGNPALTLSPRHRTVTGRGRRAASIQRRAGAQRPEWRTAAHYRPSVRDAI
jgi:hypothetical protein